MDRRRRRSKGGFGGLGKRGVTDGGFGLAGLPFLAVLASG